jgi:hypothetical protein
MDEAFSLCRDVGEAESSSPVAAHYAEIMRFVASLGMKVAAAADHIGATGGTPDAEHAPEPRVSVGTGADDLASTRPVWIRRSPAKGSTTEGDRHGERLAGSGEELQATVRLARDRDGQKDQDELGESDNVSVRAGDGEVVVAPNRETGASESEESNEDDMSATLFVPRKTVGKRR